MIREVSLKVILDYFEDVLKWTVATFLIVAPLSLEKYAKLLIQADE